MTTPRFKTAESPFKSDNTASNQCGVTLMNNQIGAVVAQVMATKDNVSVRALPSMIRVDAIGRMDFVYDEISEALGEEPGFFDAAEFDFAERDLRYTTAMFGLLTTDREFADHNKAIINGWLSNWVPRAIDAARKLQPLWSQTDAKPPRFEDGLDAVKSRFAGILADLHLDVPKELAQ